MEHDRNFTGVIGRTVADSTPSWAASPTKLAKSPNIVMIVLDDVGYAQLGQDAVLPHHIKTGPRLLGTSHRITARIERASTADEGVIVADGGRFGGWSVFIQGNRAHYRVNHYGDRGRVTSSVAIPVGRATLRVDVAQVADDEGRVGFILNDRRAGGGSLTPFKSYNFANEPLEVGRDGLTPVDDCYESPFSFTGRIVDVVIEAAGDGGIDTDALLEELMGSQ